MCWVALLRYQPLQPATGVEGQQGLARSNVIVAAAARGNPSLLSGVVASRLWKASGSVGLMGRGAHKPRSLVRAALARLSAQR